MKNKWIEEYMTDLDLSQIDWIVVNSDELKVFLTVNYYDTETESYVKDEEIKTPLEVPLGMFYLSFNYINEEFKYLLGIVPNSKGTKTIIGCISYLDECILFPEQQNPVTYILSVEVNSFFRNMGICKKMATQFIRIANEEQHIVISKESLIGRECSVFDTFRKASIRQSFRKKVIHDNYSQRDMLKEFVCDNSKFIKKRKQWFK